MGLSKENHFCDSCCSCPSLYPGHQPRPEGQARELFFSGAPLPKGCVDPDMGRGQWRWASLGLSRGETVRARPGSSPSPEENSGTCMLLPAPSTPQLGLPGPAPAHPQSQSLALREHHHLILEPQQATSGRGGPESGRPAHPPPRERGRETGLRALGKQAATRRGQEQQQLDIRMPKGIQVLHNHNWPVAHNLTPPEFQPPTPGQRKLWKGRPHPLHWRASPARPSQEPGACPKGSF